MFVEDPAMVLDEVAVLTRPGAESRRAEGETPGGGDERFRPLERITAPATLEGGDVMRVGKTLYVGASARSNAEGVAQLGDTLRPFGYDVKICSGARLPALEERMHLSGAGNRAGQSRLGGYRSAGGI